MQIFDEPDPLKIFAESESPNEGGVVKMFDSTNPTHDEPESTNEGVWLRCMMKPNRQMRRRVKRNKYIYIYISMYVCQCVCMMNRNRQMRGLV